MAPNKSKTENIDPTLHHPGSGTSGRPGVFGRPPGILASLLIVALIPLLVAVVLCSTVVVAQLSSLDHADAARQSSLSLDALLRSSVSLYREYEPSEAIVAAKEYGLTEQQLNALLHTNAQEDLDRARREVDRQQLLAPGGQFGAMHRQVASLRRSVDAGTVTPLQLEASFTALSTKLDTAWQQTFDRLQASSQWVDSPSTRSALVALGHTFTAFTSGLGEETLSGGGSLETVLTSQATPAETLGLVGSHEEFESATSGFPGGLGSSAGRSWGSLQGSALDAAFSKDVRLGMAAVLGHTSPPFSITDEGSIRDVARAEVAWANSLTNLVLASSADLRAATVSQTQAATKELAATCGALAVLLLAEVVAVLIVGRQVRRPLARIVNAATLVREGELELPPLPESGPKELALAASAMNEMSSTLMAVQEQAIALSKAEFDDPVLQRSLPGRTGAALQSAFWQLHSSVRENERRRLALMERATRDSLTGLLNRGAVLEALQRDLATMRRSDGVLELALLFIDVDGLKTINDTYGHDWGDGAIQLVAESLRSSTRASDVVGRLGGDEFVVGSLEPRGAGVSGATADRIGAQLAGLRLRMHEQDLVVGCSVGAVISEPNDEQIDAVIARADRALYVAKGNGRGQLSWSTSP